jgi:pimeloyl-ACP methyl ester carboxylesterase
MPSAREKVVLLHGFSAGGVAMQPLRHRLARAGFEASCWSYPSMFRSINHHALNLRRYLRELDAAGEGFHIVAHSMGSIVTRAALAGQNLSHVQRLVFLAPPNAGLPIARFAPRIVKRLCAPVSELADHPVSFVNSLSQTLPHQAGVIAARFDLMIPIRNTHFAGQKDHVVVNASHNSILVSAQAARLVQRFLCEGNFREP